MSWQRIIQANHQIQKVAHQMQTTVQIVLQKTAHQMQKIAQIVLQRIQHQKVQVIQHLRTAIAVLQIIMKMNSVKNF